MKRMQGFSMLELMVAMALGLMISAAAIQLFLTNQVSLNYQRGMNDVQANGRFALDQLTREVVVAGLGPAVDPTTSQTDEFIPVIFTSTPTGQGIPSLPAGSTAVSSNGTYAAGIDNQSDQLVVQYYTDRATTDCEGNNVAAGRYIVSRYFVRQDSANGNVYSLFCDAGSHNGTALATGAGTGFGTSTEGVVLLSGVDSFQVLYGIDDGPNGQIRISRYITAAEYDALAVKPEVLSVRMGLYLRSQEVANTDVPVNTTVYVLDRLLPAAIPNDGLLRRLLVTTVALRNIDTRKV